MLESQSDPSLSEIDDDPLQQRANELADALALVRVAERLGLRALRAAWLRQRLLVSGVAPHALDRWAGVLRRWVDKRRDEMVEGPRND